MSTRLLLPEPADVLVADLRGILPLFSSNVAALADARRRLLAPGGILIPQSDALWITVVDAPDLYRKLIGPWDNNGYNFDMAAARRLVVNTWSKQCVERTQLLVEPRCWATLDYTTRDDADVSGHIEWTAGRAGVAHGLSMWFDATLVDGVTFSNAPGEPKLIYGQAFFPLSSPVEVAPNDRLVVSVEARHVGDEYVWRWETRVLGAAGAEKAHHRQSSLAAIPFTPSSLRKRSADHVPRRNWNRKVKWLALSILRMDGAQSLESIARQMAAEFSERFPTWLNALPYVGELSQKYGL